MSAICKNWTQWLKETRFSALTEELKAETIQWLDSVGTAVINMAQIQPNDTVLVSCVHENYDFVLEMFGEY